jgi:hypothetical protein
MVVRCVFCNEWVDFSERWTHICCRFRLKNRQSRRFPRLEDVKKIGVRRSRRLFLTGDDLERR